MKKIILTLILFTLIYFPKFGELYQVWMTNEDYGHGFLIIPVFLYLIWTKKDELVSSEERPATWGFVVMAVWVVFYTVGVIGEISTITYLSMIFFPISAFALLMGGRAAKLILFPSVFLIFMFPIPSEIYTRITNPLMLISSNISFNLVNLLQIPILQEGNILSLPNYNMEVILACSGIRSLMSIMALTALIGYVMVPSLFIRSVLILVSIPIAILGNVIRISMTSVLAYYYSPGVAEGFSHTFAGIVTFLISLLIIFCMIWGIQWYSKKKEH